MTELPEGIDPDAILMNVERVLCPGHGEHFRPHWQPGTGEQGQIMVQMIKLFQALAADQAPDGLWAAADRLCQGRPGPAELNKLTELRPLCYFASREQLRTVLLDSEVLGIGRCTNCGKSGIGGPYSITMPMGVQELWFCVDCGLDVGDRMHKAYPRGTRWARTGRDG